ncbi:MAG TPA: SpoIIE family protein phosphatase [Actinocrinis sp.]|nr:SpoIIE family protein phosphatase [Actinocrinis sp.]
MSTATPEPLASEPPQIQPKDEEELLPSLLRIDAILQAIHTGLFVYDPVSGVLNMIAESHPGPPLSELWSRIFIDEKLPTTEAVRTNQASITALDDAGLDVPPVGLGQVVSLPVAVDGNVLGVISAAGCQNPAELPELLRQVQPDVERIAAVLGRSLTVELARVATRIFQQPQPAAGPQLPPAPFEDPLAIRASVGCGTFCWRLGEGVVHLDSVAMSNFGSRAPFAGSPVQLFSRVHQADYPLLRRTLSKAVVEEGGFAVEYRVLHTDETLRWVEARGRVTRDAQGRPVMVGVLTDTTGRPTWLQLASGPADTMADGLVVIDQDWRVIYANETSARIAELERTDLVGRHIGELMTQTDLEAWEPHLRRVGEGRQQVTFELYFSTLSRWYEVRASLQSSGIAVYLRDVHNRRAVVERDRSRALRREKASSFAAALGGTLGVDDVIFVVEQQLAALFEADGVAMHVAADGRLRLIAAVGYTAGGLAQLRTLDLDSPSPMADAVRSESLQVYQSPDELVERYPLMGQTVAGTGTGALIVVPLGYEDSTLGVVCLRFDRPRTFSNGRIAFIERTCAQLTQALYRAHRYDDELSLAARLRDDVLARPLHLVPGLELATEYRAAGVGLAVGGDWFDVIPLTRGRIGLLVGDVEGHDAHAVGGMSTVRTAVRAYAYEGYGPAAILGRVNRLVTELDPDLLATCCYVELTLATGYARIARAGHPAPVLRSPDGHSAQVDLPAGLPLGVDPGEAYRAVLTPVPAGSLLALYSDGLVESRTMSIDQGTDQLIEIMDQYTDMAVADLAHQIINQRLDHAALGDDVTLLLAKCT